MPGPIGAILSPNIDMKKHASLPFASTLCGSCTDVCPVKIDIHTQLYKWRQVLGEANEIPASKKWSMKFMGRVLASTRVYGFGGQFARKALRLLPHGLTHATSVNAWAVARELPEASKETLREWYAKQPAPVAPRPHPRHHRQRLGRGPRAARAPPAKLPRMVRTDGEIVRW